MRLAISGTYSSGKSTTSVALSHLTGIPRTYAKTMREILPEVLPGKRLEDCTVPDLFQLGMIRYAERAVHESRLPSGFISDGSSLHEWIYGKVRVSVGLHPGQIEARDGFSSAAQRHLFDEVIGAMGAAMLRHARTAYDAFAHLPIEFPLAIDGHRPVSEEFRAMCDELLLSTVKQAEIPVYVVGGTLSVRLEKLVDVFALPTVMTVSRAIDLACAEMAQWDTTDETTRTAGPALPEPA